MMSFSGASSGSVVGLPKNINEELVSSIRRKPLPACPVIYAVHEAGTSIMVTSSLCVEVSTTMVPTLCLSTHSQYLLAFARAAAEPLISNRWFPFSAFGSTAETSNLAPLTLANFAFVDPLDPIKNLASS
jgi:hypothetical protein